MHNSIMLWAMGIFSILIFILTMILIPILVLRIPENYFVKEDPPPSESWNISVVLRVFFLITKNLLGIIFLIAGLIMLLTPGQGILTIFIGILLTNFPGKRTIERKIISKPKILKTINWVRKKAKHRPLKKPIFKL